MFPLNKIQPVCCRGVHTGPVGLEQPAWELPPPLLGRALSGGPDFAPWHLLAPWMPLALWTLMDQWFLGVETPFQRCYS